jgi:hypothetical protein
MKSLIIRFSLFYFFLFAFSQLHAQDNADSKAFGIEFHGFVNLQAFYDSRQMVEAREGMFTLYPKAAVYDLNNVDINATPSFQMLAMTTRLTGKISGPDVWGFKSSALIEGDFTGVSNSDNNGFRLRHAYMKFENDKSELLIGHYWHPLDIVEAKVGTIALNSGAPMRSFSRFNQIAYTQKLGLLHILLFAGTERDYASIGPLGVGNTYQRNALIPNIHYQFRLQSKTIFAGVGFDHKFLRPRLETELGYQTTEKLISNAVTAFFEYRFADYKLKFQYIDGENLTDHLMLGGYGEYVTDSIKGITSYHAIRQSSVWTVFEKAKGQFRPGIFIGYAKNKGARHEINADVFARGSDIDHVYRIGPRLSYWSGKLMLAAEFEYTVAAYGKPNAFMEVQNAIEYANLRTLVGAFYFF